MWSTLIGDYYIYQLIYVMIVSYEIDQPMASVAIYGLYALGGFLYRLKLQCTVYVTHVKCVSIILLCYRVDVALFLQL